MPDISEQLIVWWKRNGRSFPWRCTDDPFRIFIAEVLLHRTRADNVVPIYLQLLEGFSSVHDLSQTSVETLQVMLTSLGLKWRARMLHEASKFIDENFGGNIPNERNVLLSLPGIGDYISSAIRVFTLGSDDPLIDTNTVRVISRIQGWKKVDNLRRSRIVRDTYCRLRGKKNPKHFGYAMIDLASIICLPRKPKCPICPISKRCKTGKLNFG